MGIDAPRLGEYFNDPRTELLDLFPRPPRRLLEVGCATGVTLKNAKSRWPTIRTFGIELHPEAAEQARANVDMLIEGSVEHLNLRETGLVDIDAVLFGDILEHLVNPWKLLQDLHAILTPEAMIAASIPNIANFWVIEELTAGHFTYEDQGLLDRTHLRFFTRESIAQMFNSTGYVIDRWERRRDDRARGRMLHRILGRELPTRLLGAILGRRIFVPSVSQSLHEDLLTLQFFVLAHPYVI